MMQVLCEMIDGEAIRLTFEQGDELAVFNFDDLSSLECWLMETHEAAILASNGVTFGNA